MAQENSMHKNNLWIACPNCTSRISILWLHVVDSESIELWWSCDELLKEHRSPYTNLFEFAPQTAFSTGWFLILWLWPMGWSALWANRSCRMRLMLEIDQLHKLVSWKGYQVGPQCIFKIFTYAQSIAPAHSKEKGCRFTWGTPSPPTALKCNKNIVKSGLGLLTNPGRHGNSKLRTLRTNLDTNPKSQWNAQRLNSECTDLGHSLHL